MARSNPVRERVARHLKGALEQALGREVTVNPEDFTVARGYYRTSVHADCQRWDIGFSFPDGSRVAGVVGSYDRLRDCAPGVRLSDRDGLSFTAHAAIRPPRSARP